MGDGPSESQAGDDPATFNTETGARTDEGVGYGNVNTTTAQALANDPSINPDMAANQARIAPTVQAPTTYNVPSSSNNYVINPDHVTGSAISDVSLGLVPQTELSKTIEGIARFALPMGLGNLMPDYKTRQNNMARDIIGGKASANRNADGIITGASYYDSGFDGGGDSNEPEIIRRRMAGEVIPEEEATPEISDDLAVNYLQDPYYLYSGINNQYQPYGYAQNTLVDLLRTRNMTQPQQRAANLGLFGNPGDFS